MLIRDGVERHALEMLNRHLAETHALEMLIRHLLEEARARDAHSPPG